MGGYGNNMEEMMIRLNIHDVADEEQEDDDDSERDSDGDHDSKGTDGGGGDDQNDSDGDYDSNGTGGGGNQSNSDAEYESNGTGGGGGDQNDSDGDNDSNGTSDGDGGGDNSGSDDDMMCGSGNDKSDGGDPGDGSDNGGGGDNSGSDDDMMCGSGGDESDGGDQGDASDNGGGGSDGDGDANPDGSDDGDDDKGDGGGDGGNDSCDGDDDDLLVFSQVSDPDATESSSDSVEMMGDDEEFAQAFADEEEDAWIPVHALRPDMHVDMRDRMIHRLRKSWCRRKAGGHPAVDFYYEESLRRLETAVRRLMRRLRARTMWVPRDSHIEFQTLLQEPGIILLPTNFDQFLTHSLTRIAVIQE